MPTPALKQKLLRLAEAFEGSGSGNSAGNFDGQLLSWGALHWNFGQGTLLNLLLDIAGSDAACADLLGPIASLPRNTDVTLGWLQRQGILDQSGGVTAEWRGRLRDLYNTEAALRAMAIHAEPYFDRARRLAVAFGLQTERAFALCFDIVVQNGSVDLKKFNLYLHYIFHHDAWEEWQRLKALAYGVAEGSNPRWVEDVRSRKLAIAIGGGIVHGKTYNIADDFGIRYWADEGKTAFATWYEGD